MDHHAAVAPGAPVQELYRREDIAFGPGLNVITRLFLLTGAMLGATLSVLPPLGAMEIRRLRETERRLSDRYAQGSYGQFCPVAMAAEIVCSRWTALVLREMLCGTTRFNDLRRGVPLMSPTLLSKRLKELEEAGVIATVPAGQPGAFEYRLTEAGEDLRPVVMSLGIWGQRWVESSLSLKNLDPSLLMWDMRRSLDPTPLPPRRCTINFLYPELTSAKRSWWLVIDGGKVDLCSTNPGFEIDLYVKSSLRSMTAVWMGLTTVRKEIDTGQMELIGDKSMAQSMQRWLGLSPFAKEKSRAAG